MRIKTVALLAVAVGCGLFAMLGVRQAMNGKQAGDQEDKVSVLVAVTDIPVGTRLTPENVRFRKVAVSLVPEDVVTSEEQYAERSANVPIMPNDFISMSKLTEPGVDGNSVAIPKGMRVVSVKVNDTQTHSGMIAPGDRVDVLVTYQSRGQRGMNTKTKTLLEFIQIFATGNQTENDRHKDHEAQVKNVSLLVSPEQASYVYLAERKGQLSLVWRHKADDEHVQVASIDERLMEELQGTIDKDFNNGYAHGTHPEDIQPETASVSSWLNEQETAEVEPAEPKPVTVVAKVEDPLRPTWKMVIFAGEESQTVELELPEAELPAEELPAEELDSASLEGLGVSGGTEPVSAPVEKASPFGTLMEQFRNLPFGN